LDEISRATEAARLMWLRSMLLVSTGAKAQTEACLSALDELG
jgi:hypothetical protein